MKVKIFLEEGETQESADDLLEKAFTKKHEHNHVEKFEDPLVEELLEEFDAEAKQVVFLNGFEEAMIYLLEQTNDN